MTITDTTRSHPKGWIRRLAAAADTTQGMGDQRAPLGLLIAALGAAVLAVSVFQPWYGVSITASGAATAKQQLALIAREYGNATLQAKAHGVGARFDSLAGRQLATVSAHQTMGHVSLILLALAGVALLASVFRLADLRGPLAASGGQVALLGSLAVGTVLFRMIRPPDPAASLLSLSLSWGIWLALLSAAVVVAGGLIAGTARTDWRRRPKVGPGPPPLGRDVASPLAVFRDRP